MNKSMITYLVVVGLCLGSNSALAEYKIIEGSFYEICRDYVENMNQFQKDELICSLKFSIEKSNFSLPRWSPVDKKTGIRSNISFQAEHLRLSGHEKLVNKRTGEILSYMNNYSFHSASFDIDHDGEAELVMQSRSDCDKELGGWMPTLHVVDKNYAFDLSHGNRYLYGKPFFYKGRIFLAGERKYSKKMEMVTTISEIGIGLNTLTQHEVCTIKWSK